MVPPVEGCRPVRSRLRSHHSSDLRNRCIGHQSRPLATDRASNRGAADDVEHEARVQVLRDGSRNASLEAQIPL
jgi:hypothetical protein